MFFLKLKFQLSFGEKECLYLQRSVSFKRMQTQDFRAVLTVLQSALVRELSLAGNQPSQSGHVPRTVNGGTGGTQLGLMRRADC